MLLPCNGIAQLVNGSYSPNFVMKDINNNVQNLYSYLNAGKPVLVDISASWCPNCWQFHETHALDTFYTHHGPTGDNTSMVLFIEGDQSSLACLEGSTGVSPCGDGGQPTQGNWVAGTKYPEILTISPNSDSVIANYNTTYFPYIFIVCPSRKFLLLDWQTADIQMLDSTVLTCPSPSTATLDAAVYGASMPAGMCGGSFTPTFTLQNYGSTTLTSCSVITSLDGTVQSTTPWTGSLAEYAIANVSIPAITINTTGTHYLNFNITAPNGGTDMNLSNDTLTIPFTADMATVSVPFVEGFTSATFPPAGWTLKNFTADGSSWSLSTWAGGFGNSTSSAYMKFFSFAVGDVCDMMTLPVDFSSVINPIMTFSLAYERYAISGQNDTLQVLISTDCGTTWNKVYNKYGASLSTVGSSITTSEFKPTAAQWRSDTVNLSAFAGQSKVFIKFRGISDYGNDCYVDDINICQSTVGIKGITNPVNYLDVFPNPFSNKTNVEFSLVKAETASFGVYNLIGEEVLSVNETTYSAGTHTVVLNASDLCQGIYLLNVIIGSQKFIQKLTVK